MPEQDANKGSSALRDALGFPSVDGAERDKWARRRGDGRRGVRSTGGAGRAQITALPSPNADEMADVVRELCERVTSLESSLAAAVVEVAGRAADEAVARANDEVIARVRQELIGFSARLADALEVQGNPNFGRDLEDASWFEATTPEVAIDPARVADAPAPRPPS